MIPEESLWPPFNDIWDFHSGRKDFNSVKVYLDALYQRYGKPANIEELAMKAQWMNYEAIRPMFEAFVVNWPAATGVVQWQLNSAWPEFYWQLYDWYMMPTGAYFGTQKACRPVNVIYNYDDRKIYVSNDTRKDMSEYSVKMSLYDSQSNVIAESSQKLSLRQNTSGAFGDVPVLPVVTDTYFLHATLCDSNDKLVADNFYWLSGQEDQMDWDQYFWFYTPQKKFANFTALNQLPKSQVTASKKVRKEKGEWVVEVTISNTSKNIAFCIEMMLLDDSGNPVLPVFWDDNYVSLVKDDTRTITVRCYEDDCVSEPKVVIRGVNIDEIILYRAD
jgi:exo-1,4-beta-D-glucosaminidase